MMANNVIEMFRAPVALPPEIKSLKAWLVWKLESKPGEKKPRKVPYYIDGRRRSGIQGSQSDLDGLATFDRAVLACSKGGYAGVGLAILPQWNITAIDFDAVVQGEDIDPAVSAVIKTTYSELSPSGTGVRAFFRGKGPGNRKDNDGTPQVEFFSTKGFVTVTGNQTWMTEAGGLETTLADLTPEIKQLYIDRFGEDKEVSVAVREDVDPRQVREMLDTIRPDCSHEIWFRVGLALHHQFGAEGFALWDEWSAGCADKYPGQRELRKRWNSIRGDANPVTIGSLRQLARDGGWSEDVTDQFDVLAPDDVIELDPDDARAVLRSLEKNKQGNPKAVIKNVEAVLSLPKLVTIRLARDTFLDSVMWAPEGTDQWREFHDSDYTELRLRLERELRFLPVGRELIRDVVEYVADKYRFDSAQRWLDGIRWDGVKRIETFFSAYMGSADSSYTRAMGLYLWSAMAGRVIEPGVKADIVPILISRQGTGKSSALMAMVPSPEHYIEVDFAADEDDLARKMRGALLAEFAELKGLRSREVEHIKALITRQFENWTPKFKEFNQTYPRRTIFIGTTNQDEFLADETGNRRFGPVKVAVNKLIDVQAIRRDMEQLWAEGAATFLVDGIQWRNAEKLATEVHGEHMVSDPWDAPIEKWINEPAEFGGEKRCEAGFRIADLLFGALGINAKDHNRSYEMRASAILRRVGLVKKDKRVAEKIVKHWFVATSCYLEGGGSNNECPF